MSSKKRSFDLAPSRRKGAAKKEEQEVKVKKNPHPQLSQRPGKKPLRERRREAATRGMMVWSIVALIILGAGIYGLWRPEVRIESVHAEQAGDDAKRIERISEKALEGTYYYVIPRNSFFFYPEREIRADILDAFPQYAAVSLERSGFDALRVSVTERISAFRWCGAPESLSASDVSCYNADQEGLVFSYANTAASSTGTLHVYAKLEGNTDFPDYPVRARVVGSDNLPAILRFAHSIEALGVPLAAVAIEGDEASLFVAPSTRITYVIGHEEEARKNAAAAFGTLNLRDGSIEYVDLRFDGKVYLKRREEE